MIKKANKIPNNKKNNSRIKKKIYKINLQIMKVKFCIKKNRRIKNKMKKLILKIN
jgi:hypothetical protein